ncbi:hypothetical protein BST61_g2732 [Cercospora zeina]
MQCATLLASDVVSELMFGEALGGLETQKMHAFFHKVHFSNLASPISYHLPLFYAVLSRMPIPANVVSCFLAKAAEDDESLTLVQVTVEAGSFIIAGSETASESLTYPAWAVLKHPETRQALDQQLATVAIQSNDAELQQLPVLNAIIEEPFVFTLPSQCRSLESCRKAVLLSKDISCRRGLSSTLRLGYHIGILLSFRALRDSITAVGYPTAQRHFLQWWPFGAGSRTCIGQHLPMMKMRLATMLFFKRFAGARLAPETSDASMALPKFSLVVFENQLPAILTLFPLEQHQNLLAPVCT